MDKTNIEIVKNMLRKNIDLQIIQEITNLSGTELIQLQAQH